MKTLTLTNRELKTLGDVVRAVRLHVMPSLLVYAQREAECPTLRRDLSLIADAIDAAENAPQTRAPSVGRHRWPRHGNVCELCGARRVRNLLEIRSPISAAKYKTTYVHAGQHYATFPCPGGPK